MSAGPNRFVRGDVVALGALRRATTTTGATVKPTYAVIVLEDTPDRVIVCSPVGSSVLLPTGPRGGPNGGILTAASWDGGHDETAWYGDAVVKVHRWGEPWSVWRWLEPTGWSADRYVNLAEIRNAGMRATTAAEARGWPFDADWDAWIPASEWGPAHPTIDRTQITSVLKRYRRNGTA